MTFSWFCFGGAFDGGIETSYAAFRQRVNVEDLILPCYCTMFAYFCAGGETPWIAANQGQDCDEKRSRPRPQQQQQLLLLLLDSVMTWENLHEAAFEGNANLTGALLSTSLVHADARVDDG